MTTNQPNGPFEGDDARNDGMTSSAPDPHASSEAPGTPDGLAPHDAVPATPGPSAAHEPLSAPVAPAAPDASGAPDAPGFEPAPDAPAAAEGAPSGGGAGVRRAGAWVAIVVTIIGALAIVGTVSRGVLDGLGLGWGGPSVGVSWGGDRPWGGDRDDRPWGGAGGMNVVQSEQADVTGVTSIDAVVSSAGVEIRYDDVERATLEVRTNRGDAGRWTFAVDGDTLTVHQDSTTGQMGWNNRIEATVVLPESLESTAPALDASVESGVLSVDGDFGDVAMTVSSGAADYSGSASTMSFDVQSGLGDLKVSDAEQVDVSVGSGMLDAKVSGAQPQSTTVQVNSGIATVALPKGPYNVTGTESSGVRDVTVQHSPTATSTLEVNVSSGLATVSQ